MVCAIEVHALIAHTNRTGEKKLRELELRLLGGGVTVTRTANDVARYHANLVIVDEPHIGSARSFEHPPAPVT